MKKILPLFLMTMIYCLPSLAATQPPAKDVTVNTSPFSKNLNSTDVNVQLALQTIDQMSASSASPAGPGGSLQTNGGSGNFGSYAGSTCANGQVANALSISGALTCTSYLTLTGLSATAPITYNNATGAIGWTNSNNYIPLTALSSALPGLTYNNSTGIFSLTSGYYFPSTTDQSNWNAKQSALTFSNSLQNSSGTVTLVGDSASPGASYYYGTNGSGSKGFYTIPSGMIYPATGIANSTGSAWGTSYSTTGSGTTVVLSNSPTLVTPALGTPSSGVATNLTGTASGLTAGNVLTNANLTGPITSVGNATSVASQTGTGSTFVMNTSPILVTPTLGVASATSINKVTITAPATSATLTIANGKILTSNNTITLSAGADGITETMPSTSFTTARTDASNTFTGHQTIEGVTSTGATGTGNLVFSIAPIFTANVGIGSATPGQTLDVTGTIRATQFNLTSLLASEPVFTDSNKNLVNGFISGTGNVLVTANGSYVSGDCIKVDASGNHIDSGSPCGITGPGGSSGQIQYNNAGSLGGVAGIVISNGNVGIGSTAPGQILDVQGTLRTTNFNFPKSPTNGYILTSDAAGNASWQVNAASGTVQSGTANRLTFYSGTTILAAGLDYSNGTNLSIGTSANTNLLDVYGGMSIGTGLPTAPTNGLTVQGNVGIGTSTAVTQALVVQGSVQTQGNSNNTLLNIGGGNVGIGSPTPGALLDVAGTLRTTGFILTTGATNGYVLTSDGSGNGTWKVAGGTVGPGTTNQEAVFTSSSTIGSGVITDNGNIGIGSTAPGAQMDVQGTLRILGSGNVGIGTASPGTSLDVHGAIRSTSTGSTNFGGNVGIGSANPAAALDIQGTVRISSGGGSANTGVCWCGDGKTLGHFTGGTITSATCSTQSGAC